MGVWGCVLGAGILSSSLAVPQASHHTFLLLRPTPAPGATKPHHVMGPDGSLVLGYGHLGMLGAARWIVRTALPLLRAALAEGGAAHGYSLRVVGGCLEDLRVQPFVGHVFNRSWEHKMSGGTIQPVRRCRALCPHTACAHMCL